MPRNESHLIPGSVLHIKHFTTRGHPPKNKYVLIIGSLSESTILAFLISSQLDYLHRESHKNEVVRIPQDATNFLRSESIIQCFQLEELSKSAICDGFDNGSVTCAGRLPIRYLHRIRDVTQHSYLLSQADIEAALSVLPKSTP